MNAKTLHIVLAQTNPIVGNLSYNLEKIRKVRSSAPVGTDLIVYPELATSGYPPEDLVLKPAFMAEIARHVADLAQDTKDGGPDILLSTPWIQNDVRVSAVHLIGGGQILATRYKNRLPNYGVFDEQRVFKSGPLPNPIEFQGHKIGVMVCEDMWHSDASRHLAGAGASMLIVLNGSPYDTNKAAQRLDQARQRVVETGLPLIYVNQCGGQDEVVFDGASFILNEKGGVILQARSFCEETHHTVWEKTAGAPQHWLCLTDDVPHPAFSAEEGVYTALMIGLRDYVTKNGFPGVLIGMSGGVDSALTAAIAVDALGPDSVRGVRMPSQYTSKASMEDAEDTCRALGISCDTIPISEGIAALEQTLAHHFTKNTPGTTHENLQSRARGVILMALSNASGRMVLSTGNKSEMAVGYATLYGDMCGGFNVLKDIYKTHVYKLAHWRNTRKPMHGFGPTGIIFNQSVLTKAPTAELRPNQTDQDSLPPYEILDGILNMLIEEDKAFDDIVAAGFDSTVVRRVWNLLDAAEYKRRQAPPGVKITSRAFGRERRYPITNGYRA